MFAVFTVVFPLHKHVCVTWRVNVLTCLHRRSLNKRLWHRSGIREFLGRGAFCPAPEHFTEPHEAFCSDRIRISEQLPAAQQEPVHLFKHVTASGSRQHMRSVQVLVSTNATRGSQLLASSWFTEVQTLPTFMDSSPVSLLALAFSSVATSHLTGRPGASPSLGGRPALRPCRTCSPP